MSLARNRLPVIVTVLIVAAFGVFGVSLVTRVGYLAVPAALGLPSGLPGLRFVPVGETTWLMALTDSVAALVLVALVALARGGFWRTCGAFLTGAVLADLLRAVVLAQTASTGLGAYAGYLAGALASGLVWGVALGWLAGLAALPRKKHHAPAGAG
ncbi:hypothetical protein [Microtetraspora sp. NBRC 16547]|uniref:hypothetical protein n=1 Tax=Microtetraspora sp. NBRC 16547 TaxID=3030993 RepID=UPI0024A13171|nr:hypothetical protein [Microtetraspora sp. NBRC 16547]GLX00459.1 hypothetical protein Misp02_45450 [Microtetraspora sp. NBRC 16547]